MEEFRLMFAKQDLLTQIITQMSHQERIDLMKEIMITMDRYVSDQDFQYLQDWLDHRREQASAWRQRQHELYLKHKARQERESV